MNTRNLVLVISSLRMGGAEKVATSIAGHFAARGARVRLVTFAPASEAPFRPLDPRVERVGLGLEGVSSGTAGAALGNLRRIRALRRLLREDRPDAVISFIDRTNVRTLLAAAGLGIPVVVSERTYPFPGALGLAWRLLRRLLYPSAAALVVPARDCGEGFPFLREKVRVIPNPVEASGGADPSAREAVVLGMGRLVPRKGFDVLVRAFARIAEDAPGWTLRLQGDGPERARLLALIREAGLESRVSLEPATADPEASLRRAAIFALPSRYEGFPNVLCEAMACGCATVASDCRSGPGEIITDNENGILVPVDAAADLAEALLALVRDPGRRQALGEEAAKAMARYAPSLVLPRWDALLDEVLARRRA